MRTEGQTEGHTNMSKLKVAFRNFFNAPKKFSVSTVHSVYTFRIILTVNRDYFPKCQ